MALDHHHHLVDDLRQHGQVVGDEQRRGAVLGEVPVEHTQHRGLRGDVEGGGRLITDRQYRVVDQGHRDQHPLALSAGQLVRIAVGDALHVGQRDGAQHLQHPGSGVTTPVAVQDDELAELAADPHRRVQRRHRLLEDHAVGVAAQPGQSTVRGGGDLDDAVRRTGRRHGQANAAAHPGGLRQQAEQRQAGDRLARTGLPDQSHPLAVGDAERQPAHHVGTAPAEPDPQVVDPHQRLGHRTASRSRGSSRSRRPSPNRLKPSTARPIASPGQTASIGAV
ncbi:hypothetical protein SDC9_155336 [bioreactor metagenome]|uniref:Uncharacterized protein n=1 Tax=bioreactor metagenome TaxID=1076179 RepID=A0A645F2L2_9ZZZZ